MTKKAAYPLLAFWVAALLPLAGYLYLLMRPEHDPLFLAPRGHFYLVTPVALLAAVIAVMVGMAGRRLRNIQVTFLAAAFTTLAMLFMLHGLSTPGFLLPTTVVPGVAAQMSVMLTSFWLWLSARPADHPLVRKLAGWQPWLVSAWTAILLLLNVVGMAYPELVAIVPVHLSPLKWAAMAVTLAFNLLTARQYWQSYRYSRFPLQAAILGSTGWVAVAQVIMTTGTVWRGSWWIYHFLLLGAVVLMLVGLVRQYSTGASIGTAVRGLFTLDPAERLEAGISPSVRQLIIATETWDRYTAGHNYRVALFGLRIGVAMGLPPEQLRALAQGGVLHDLGKIEVPQHILNKPGKLTPEERAVIERHPATGYDLCKRLGFMPDELTVIRSHHEKWDGTGYPDRLQGEQIPLLARVLAVADVYDALTSTRSYRRAWTHEAAMEFLAGQAGTHFDPACVQAWAQVAADGPPAEQAPAWVLPAPGGAGPSLASD